MKGWYKVMMTRETDKERTKRQVSAHGFEVSEIGVTLQWTMTNGKTCVQWFDENGAWVKTEHWG